MPSCHLGWLKIGMSSHFSIHSSEIERDVNFKAAKKQWFGFKITAFYFRLIRVDFCSNSCFLFFLSISIYPCWMTRTAVHHAHKFCKMRIMARMMISPKNNWQVFIWFTHPKRQVIEVNKTRQWPSATHMCEFVCVCAPSLDRGRSILT